MNIRYYSRICVPFSYLFTAISDNSLNTSMSFHYLAINPCALVTQKPLKKRQSHIISLYVINKNRVRTKTADENSRPLACHLICIYNKRLIYNDSFTLQ